MHIIKIEYGQNGVYVDVTKRAYQKFYNNGIIIIPAGNHVCDEAFGDPLWGIVKHIKVSREGRTEIYPSSEEARIHVQYIDTALFQSSNTDSDWFNRQFLTHPLNNLALVHENLRFEGGNFMEEFPEQTMAMTYIKKDNKVLEIGSNIGRNTLVIATILGSNQNKNFVTMECDLESCRQLENNLFINNYAVQIEPSALSRRRLQQKGWDTIPLEGDKPTGGYTEVKTISFPQLETKYGIQFDTLVADCEGALYYILMDEPNMLDNFHTIIMENDYHVLEQKQYVDQNIISKGFRRVFYKEGGWGPCSSCFFEVWQK